MRNLAIILSGGCGSRMHLDVPKQYIKVYEKPIIQYCIETFLSIEAIAGLIIASAPEWKEYIEDILTNIQPSIPIYYSLPGETRQFTIYNSLKIAAEHFNPEDSVIIHDSARPLVSKQLINNCLEACVNHDGVLPILPLKDTVYQSNNGVQISSLLPRETIFIGQAPEAFRLGMYLQAHKALTHEELMEIKGSTELAYKVGLDIKLIPGEEVNFKITTYEDLSRFEHIVKQHTNES